MTLTGIILSVGLAFGIYVLLRLMVGGWYLWGGNTFSDFYDQKGPRAPR